MTIYCGTCHKQIAPGHVSMSIMNEQYHPDCLTCSKCGVRLGDRPFIQKRNGELYCQGQCENAVTLPPINNGTGNSFNPNASLRRVFSLKSQQNPNAFRDRINYYQDLADQEEDVVSSNRSNPSRHSEIGKRSYNLDLYRKPQAKLSTDLDIFVSQNQGNDRSRENIYEPFSYNHPNNGTVPSTPSGAQNSNKTVKKVEPFSYNYREELTLAENEEASQVKKHKTKAIKTTAEPFNYNRIQDSNPTNLNTFKKSPNKPNLKSNIPYATFEMNELDPTQPVSPSPSTTDVQQQQPEPYKRPSPTTLFKMANSVLNPIDSNRFSSSSMNNINNNNVSQIVNNQNGYPMNEISDYCHRCHQYINKDKYLFNYNSYHKKCYTCFRCNSELFRMKKVLNGPNDAYLYCEPCHTDMFGPKCPKCNETVTPYMLSSVHENKLYHKECFVCQRCKRNLANEKFVKSGNLIICKKCY